MLNIKVMLPQTERLEWHSSCNSMLWAGWSGLQTLIRERTALRTTQLPVLAWVCNDMS